MVTDKKHYLVRIIILFVGIILSNSCNFSETDNFYNTKRTIKTDKLSYDINDTIIVTLTVTPIKKEKKIRIYDNYKNINFYFSLFNGEAEKYSKNESQDSLPETEITDFLIYKDEPLVIEYHGVIYSDTDSVMIEFKSIDYLVSFNKKSLLKEDAFIRIHGICLPINAEFGAPIEEYFETYDFKINL